MSVSLLVGVSEGNWQLIYTSDSSRKGEPPISKMFLAVASVAVVGFANPPPAALKRNWIPFLPRPTYLDDTYAADVGFDPLGLVQLDGPWWSVAGASSLDRRVAWMREAEVKHARLAMLAAAGWPLSELWHGSLAGVSGLPFELDATQGRAPSVLNGNIGEAAPVLLFTLLFSSYLEIRTLDQVHGLTSTGKTLSRETGSSILKSYTPGDLGFDPLNLYGFFGWQARSSTDTDRPATRRTAPPFARLLSVQPSPALNPRPQPPPSTYARPPSCRARCQ